LRCNQAHISDTGCKLRTEGQASISKVNVDGYYQKWWWGPTNPRPVKIDQVDNYCCFVYVFVDLSVSSIVSHQWF